MRAVLPRATAACVPRLLIRLPACLKRTTKLCYAPDSLRTLRYRSFPLTWTIQGRGARFTRGADTGSALVATVCSRACVCCRTHRRCAPRFCRWVQECAAIGIATTRFPLFGRFPGWDRHSYGWHSDDGKVFHDSGAVRGPPARGRRQFGLRADLLWGDHRQGRSYGGRWAQGDTVGCGVIYSVHRPGTGSIFFTRNGEYLGELPRLRVLSLLPG